MFVPVLAIRAHYAYRGDAEGLASAAFVIGIEREGEARMAPIWLDQPPRMLGGAGARPYQPGSAPRRRTVSPLPA